MMVLFSLGLLACGPKAIDVGEDSGTSTSSVDTDGSGETDGGTETGATDDTGSGGGTDDTGDTETTGGTGETGDTGEPMDTADTGTTAPAEVDYRLSGPFGVSAETQEIETGSCTATVEVFTPDGGGPLVVLGHGFLRGSVQMVGWAEHYASWGLTVAAPDLCHSSILDTDHEVNGADMVDIAEALGGDAVYGGHSAGGLAALLSASYDAAAVGVMGLDAVDAFDLGVDAVGGVSAPVYGLFGESSLCNASSNGVTMYAAASDWRGMKVTEADHCDFEAETDWVCTVACTGSNDDFSDNAIRDTILGASTAALMELAGLDAASGWWGSGTYYDEIVDAGAVSVY